jgi:hypothetical protein
MIPTPFALYKHFNGEKGYDFYNAFECDLFGVYNWGPNIVNKDKKEWDNNICMFYGLYKGLYLLGVSAKEIYRCYLSNKLDELIHIKYCLPWLEQQQYASEYYKLFCEKKLIIGKTFEKYENNEEYEPYIYKNISPLYHLQDGYIGFFRQTEETNIIMQNKISHYKEQDNKKNRNFKDEEYCDIETIIKLIKKQDSKCYICGDNMIFQNWKPYCLYQFTLDRIDNTLPHNKNNVLLSCYYCKCFEYSSENNSKYKQCINGCHTIKRKIERTKQNINNKEIEKLLLK